MILCHQPFHRLLRVREYPVNLYNFTIFYGFSDVYFTEIERIGELEKGLGINERLTDKYIVNIFKEST